MVRPLLPSGFRGSVEGGWVLPDAVLPEVRGFPGLGAGAAGCRNLWVFLMLNDI